MPLRSLQVSDIPEGMIAHLDRQEIVNGHSCILIECIQCHTQRWVKTAYIRSGHTKTSICRPCYLQRGNVAFLQPHEIPQKDTIVFIDRQELRRETRGRQQQMLRILAECPDCHKQRWIRVNSFRNGKTKSTVCNSCSRKRQPPPLPKMGTQDANGYRMVHIKLLSPEDRELAEQHLRLHRGAYVYEHRLVALKTYGPKAATPGIVVRHVDGDKLNNDPQNLILGTQGDNARDHVEAIAEMKIWRGLALHFLNLLVAQQQNLKRGD